MSATEIKDEGKVVTNQRTLVWLLGLAIACAVAWTTVRATAEEAKAKAIQVSGAQASDHDTVVKTAALLEQLAARTERIEGKLDRALERGGMTQPILLGGGK